MKKLLALLAFAIGMLAAPAARAGAPVVLNVNCNSQNDVTVTIQEALNAVAGTGNTLILPANPGGATCLVRGLAIKSNTDFEIEGTLFMEPSTNSTLLAIATGATNVHIWGRGTINGNAANQSTAGACGICGQGISKVLIDGGLTIANFYSWPINVFGGSSNVHLSHLTITGGGGAGAASEFAGPGSSNLWADNLTITGNTADNGFAFYGGVTGGGITDSTITGNYLAQVIVLSDSGQSGANSNIIIAHNVMGAGTDSGNSPGVLVFTNNGGSELQSNVVIAGNTIYSNLGSGIDLQVGTYNATVTGNVIHGDTGYGIALFAGPQTLTGNVIYDEGQGGVTGVGVDFGAGNTGTIAQGNYFFDDQGASKTMKYGFSGTAGANTMVAANFYGALVSGGAGNNATYSSSGASVLDAPASGWGLSGSFENQSSALAFGQIPAVVTQSGGMPAGTFHAAFAACTTSGSTNCTATFTNGAVFSATADIIGCNVTSQTGDAGYGAGSLAASASTVTLYASTSGTNHLSAVCWGY